jgi:hypothetical protein
VVEAALAVDSRWDRGRDAGLGAAVAGVAEAADDAEARGGEVGGAQALLNTLNLAGVERGVAEGGRIRIEREMFGESAARRGEGSVKVKGIGEGDR